MSVCSKVSDYAPWVEPREAGASNDNQDVLVERFYKLVPELIPLDFPKLFQRKPKVTPVVPGEWRFEHIFGESGGCFWSLLCGDSQVSLHMGDGLFALEAKGENEMGGRIRGRSQGGLPLRNPPKDQIRRPSFGELIHAFDTIAAARLAPLELGKWRDARDDMYQTYEHVFRVQE